MSVTLPTPPVRLPPTRPLQFRQGQAAELGRILSGPSVCRPKAGRGLYLAKSMTPDTPAAPEEPPAEM